MKPELLEHVTRPTPKRRDSSVGELLDGIGDVGELLCHAVEFIFGILS